jgi:type I restriction enzyme M protein
MEQTVEKIQEQLKVKGYTHFQEPVVDEEDGSTILVAFSGFTLTGNAIKDEELKDRKIIYVKILAKGTAITPDMEQASLFEAQNYKQFPDFVWVTDGERNFYGDCYEEKPLAEIPSVIDVQPKARKTLSRRESWSREIYHSLQKRFDELHERLYGPAGKDNISSTNDAIDELSKLIFMESFRLHHPTHVLTGEYAGTKLYDVLDYKYIEENGKDAVAVIRAAFKQIKDHKDYTAINNNGESCPIFGDDEYIRLENPANFVAAFRCFQELGEYIDDQSNRVKATLKDLSDDVQGRLYDVLLRGKYDNKVGQATYLTPREVTEAMTAMVLHDITSDSKEASKLIAVDGKGRPTFRVLDPTCGSGGFLIKAYLEIKRYLEREFTGPTREAMIKRLEMMKEHSFVGADSSRNMILKARINLIMHGMPRAPVYWVDNSLTTDRLKPESYDVILTNPPFGARSVKASDPEGQLIIEKFSKGIDEDGRCRKSGLCLGSKPDAKGKWKQVNSTDQAILFIDRNLQLLKPGGYLLIVLPDGVLSNSGYRYVREYLMGRKNEVTGEFEGGRTVIKAVVSLPTVTFKLSGTGAKTSFLYLRKKENEGEKQGPIFMAVADEIGFDVKNKVEVALGNDRNDLLRIVDAYKKGDN